MSDILSTLNTLEIAPQITFCKTEETAVLPVKVCKSSLYKLCPVEDYTITTENIHDIYIDTGIAICAAANVEITAIVPKLRYSDEYLDDGIINIHKTFIINSGYRGPIEFSAFELFADELKQFPEFPIELDKYHPFCFLKVAPVHSVAVKGAIV